MPDQTLEERMATVESARSVIVTGGNAGLGYECARTIAASQDWHVVIASRNAAKAAEAVQRIIGETGNPHIEAMPLDLASLASVRAFSQAWAARDDLHPSAPLYAMRAYKLRVV